MESSSICFICGQPALPSWITVPATAWPAPFTKAQGARAAACATHATAPDTEAAAVDALVALQEIAAAGPVPETQEILLPWLVRLVRAIFWQVNERPWGMPLVLVSGGLGVGTEAIYLYQELVSELKDPLLELFPEPGPHKKLDYHFFDMEDAREEDAVLWLRLPGGFVVYVYPGQL